MLIDFPFPTRYKVRVLRELPGGDTSIPILYFPAGSSLGGQDGVLVNVSPERTETWVGIFAFGNVSDFSAIVGAPHPDQFFVISTGRGYIVDAHTRDVELIRPVPICDLLIVQSLELIVFVEGVTLAAYGRDGFRWETDQLSFDGISIEQIRGRYVEGYGWDPRLEDGVPFRVDLVSGEHWGGASPSGEASPLPDS